MVAFSEGESVAIQIGKVNSLEIHERPASFILAILFESSDPGSQIDQIQVWGVSMSELPSTEEHHRI